MSNSRSRAVEEDPYILTVVVKSCLFGLPSGVGVPRGQSKLVARGQSSPGLVSKEERAEE